MAPPAQIMAPHNSKVRAVLNAKILHSNKAKLKIVAKSPLKGEVPNFIWTMAPAPVDDCVKIESKSNNKSRAGIMISTLSRQTVDSSGKQNAASKGISPKLKDSSIIFVVAIATPNKKAK